MGREGEREFRNRQDSVRQLVDVLCRLAPSRCLPDEIWRICSVFERRFSFVMVATGGA